MAYEMFGIEVDDSLNLKDNYKEIFIKNRRSKNNSFDDLYKEYCEYNELDPDGGFEKEFLDDYDDDGCLCGFYGLITTLINEELGNSWFEYEDSCVGVAATLPENDNAKNDIPSRERIAEILHDYFDDLTDDVIEPNWLEINI